jgi:hypothetical protein
VALARAYPKFRKLVAQQRAVVLGVLAQPRLRKLLKLSSLLSKVINTHFFTPVFGTSIELQPTSMVVAGFWIVCDECHNSGHYLTPYVLDYVETLPATN